MEKILAIFHSTWFNLKQELQGTWEISVTHKWASKHKLWYSDRKEIGDKMAFSHFVNFTVENGDLHVPILKIVNRISHQTNNSFFFLSVAELWLWLVAQQAYFCNITFRIWDLLAQPMMILIPCHTTQNYQFMIIILHKHDRRGCHRL